MSREVLICDTSFVSHLFRRSLRPERYDHWDESVMDRVRAGIMAVSVVTIAEMRAGFASARWGTRKVVREELRLGEFLPS